jgi:hypothetical protein
MRHLLFLGLATAAAISPAHAQYGAFDMGALTNTLSQDHVTMTERKRARQTVRPATMDRLSRALAQQTDRATASVAPLASADYTPSTAVRQRLATIMADGTVHIGQREADEMRQLVLSRSALNEYERIAPGLGFKRNDAIDAFAFYLLAQWGVANDHRADITRTQAAAVRRQAAHAYATIADQLDSNALRQEFGEMLAVQGTIMAGAHEAAARKGDRATLQRYADLARRGGRMIFTIDPTRIALTNAGFRKKR